MEQPRNLLSAWIQEEHLQSSRISEHQRQFLAAKPFPFLQLPHFLHQKKALELIKALSEEEFIPKESDLFKFSQTNDLVSSGNPVLQEFRSLLMSSDFLTFLSSVTNTKLKTDTLDLSASLYQDTDFLLCHDDQLEGRKIAFFYYLSDLEEKDGGALALFDSEKGKPVGVAKRVYPQFNTFAFFLVSPLSFHQVEEVVSDTQRIAISGWFHGN